MRPKILTPRTLILLLAALAVFGGLARWGSLGFPLPGQAIPSTAGKLAFLSERDGKSDLYLLDPKTDTAPARLTTDGQANREPTFGADGAHLFFTTERGGLRQLAVMDAAPERKITPLTRTSTAKQQPQVLADGRVYFLDGGKVASTTRDASDAKIVFPSAEALNENPFLKALFREGGIASMAVSPDGTRIALAINREQGQVLVLYLPDELALSAGQPGEKPEEDDHGHEHRGVAVVIGMAERIQMHFAASGGLAALFVGGSPFAKPQPIPAPSHQERELSMDREVSLPIPPLPESMKEVYLLVQINPDLSVAGQLPLPIPPQEIALAGGKDSLLALTGDPKTTPGMILLNLGSQSSEPKKIFDKPCQDAQFSPDGSQLAFSDGTDIFTVSTDGSSEPKNLTGGKLGKATHPAWSPARK
jgi:hypothetical protein